MAKTKVKVIVALFAVIALSLLAVCFGRLFSPAEAKAADGTYDDTAAVALMQDLIIDGQATLTENVVFDLTQQSDILGSQLPDGLLRFPATYSHKNVTIDLGGRTLEIITGSDKCCLHVADGITVTVKNGTLKGSSAGSFAWGETGSKIVLEDVDIKFETSSTETGAAGDEGTTPGGSSEDHVILSNGSVELSGVTFDTNVSDPVAVFTKDAETGEFVGTDVTYGTLQDAINATGYNECIQVSDKIKSVNAEEKSVTESIVIPEGQKINLDLNGYTLKNVKEAGKYAAITNNGELYVYNGIIAATSAAKMSSSNDDDYIPYGIYNYGKLTANNVTITSYSTGSGTAVEDPDKPTSSVSVGAYGIYSKGSSVNLRNIIVTSNSASTTSSAVYNNSGILAIYGGEYTGKTYAVYSGTTNESVTINGGTYKADTGTGSGTGIYTNTSTTVTITGVTVNAVGTGVRIGGNESAMISDSTITVNNSKNNSKSYALNIVSAGLTVDSVKLEANASAGNGYGIYTSELKTLTIKGDSSIKASSKAGFNVYAMEIKGDETSVVNIESCDIQSGKLDIYSGATVNISGGTFGDLIYKEGSKFVITGGTFATVPNLDLLADDYAIYKEDGKYVVKADDGNATLSKNDSVMIGDTGYDTLTEALSDVKDGDTVTLLKNVAGDVEIASGVITLDLNGNTLDGNIAVSAGTLNVIGNGNVTGTVGKTGGTLAVSGGSYTNVIAADCIAEGYVLEAQRYDGALTVEVVAGTATASMTIGDDTTEYKFDTIASAIAAAPYEDKATVKLLSDITLGDDDHMTISVSGKEVVLDLNENTLEATSEFNVGTNSFIYISDGANFTIQNGKIVRNITSDSAIALIEVAGGISEDTRATLNLGSDLTIEQNGNLAIFIRRYATLNSAANISVTGGGVIESNGSADNYYSGYTIINITGGNLTSDGVAIFHPQKGELNITGGTITGATGIVLRGGELNISGDAVVKATGEKKTPEELFATRPDGGTDGALNTGDAVLIYNAGYPAEEMMKDSSITGGKFESENGSAVSSLTHTYNTSTKYEQVNNFISGGEFDGMPESDYIAAGADLYMNEESGFAVATESAPEGYEKVVATIDDTAYTSLAEAVTAAGENATIVLYADVTESVTVAADDVITLDLNGKTLTSDTDNVATILNNGTLSIVDTSDEKGTITRGATTYYVIRNEGVMTISDVNVENLTSDPSSLVANNTDCKSDGAAQLTIKSGSFTSAASNAVKNDEYGILTIDGGVFETKINTHAAVQTWATATINGGTFTATAQAISIEVYNGQTNTTTINNGTFNAPTAVYMSDGYDVGATYPGGDMNIEIKGGTFNGAIAESATCPIDDEDGGVAISGGTFTKAFDSDYLADNVNLYQTETGFAAATEQNAPENATKVVAFVDDKAYGSAYGSIQEAINAADGVTVTLYDDVTLSEALTIDKAVTIDLNGKTVSASTTAANITASATIKNGTIDYVGETSVNGLVVTNNATLTLDGVTVDYEGSGQAVRLGDYNGGTPTENGGNAVITDSVIKGGVAGVAMFGTAEGAANKTTLTATDSTITGSVYYGIATNGIFYNNDITLSGTTVKGSETGTGMYLPGSGETTITGGSVKGATGIEIRAGKLTIDGATVTATGAYEEPVPNGSGTTVEGVAIAVSQHTTERPIEVTVNGGEFSATGTDGKAFYETDTVTGETEPSEDVTITIDGGNFKAPVESENKTGFVEGGNFTEVLAPEYVSDTADLYVTANGYAVYDEGDTPAEGDTKVIAMVGDKAYDKLADAVAAATDDGAVTLYVDVKENITVASGTVTIDLAGNTLNGFIKSTGATVNVKNGTVSGSWIDGAVMANGEGASVTLTDTVIGNPISISNDGAVTLVRSTTRGRITVGSGSAPENYTAGTLTITDSIIEKEISVEMLGKVVISDTVEYKTSFASGVKVTAKDPAALEAFKGYGVTTVVHVANEEQLLKALELGVSEIEVQSMELSAPVEITKDVKIYGGNKGDHEIVGSFIVKGEIEVTIEDVSFAGDGTGAALTVTDGAKLTYSDNLSNVTVAVSGFEAGISVDGNSSATVNNITFENISAAAEVKDGKSDAVTFNGCTIPEDTAQYVAVVTDATNLASAIADSKFAKVTLGADVELTSALVIERSVTLDLNGYDITGNINVTAADVTITAPETSDSAINGIVTVTNADDFTLSNVTVNYTVTGEEEADSLKIMGAVVIDGSENATIDNVTVNVTANNSGLNVVSVWVKNDSTATISDSTIDLEFRATEENRTQGQVVRAETSDLTIKDSVITTTDYGVIFYGDMSATDAQADNTAAFDKLVIENSTVTVTDTDEIVGAYAVSGNGSNRNGTIIEITGSTITSDVATAIYHPQYGNMTITDSVITGASGIEMRSGNLTVTSGTITATGAFEVEPNGNGNTASGVAVAVSQHTTEMKINVQLNGGTFNATGENGKAFYETDTVTGVDPSADVTVDLNGGTYEAAVEAKNIKNFINDGLYKEEPKEDAFAEGYEGVLYNGYYQVVEATTDDPAALLTAKTEAQADVRSYLLNACGMTIADVKALAADETLGAAAQAVIDAYAAMDGATSESKLAIARLSVMDAIDALDKALDTALADYKAAAIDEINSYGAEKDVAVPTATIMAINSAKTEAEVDMYKEYAIGEIDDIVAYREAISNIKIPNYSDTLDDLSAKLDTLTGNLTSVSNTLGEKIDAVKTDIATVTADIDKLETTLAGLADSDDVNGIAEDISDIIEQLAAIKSTVDGISVAVDEATAVEEVKTEAAAEIDAWLEDYIDSIVESSATSVRDILTAKAAMADDLRSKLVDAFGEDNAALIEKYYDDAMAAIENATSASEATNAVSTFKAQVASVEAAAGNTTSLAGVYVLLAIILVVAIVAVVLAVVLKRKGGEPAPAAAQPAPEAAPAPAPAAETAPAPAATEEAPAAQPEDESAATATDEDTERVVITASTRTFEEAYEALDPELRDLFDKVKAYALSKNGTTEVKLSNCICIKYGSKKVVRLTVRRSYPLAMFVIENEMVKDFRRNATGALKLKVPATELVIRDEEDLKAAYSMVDLAVDQILKDIEAAKERRRAARRARRAQREAEAGEAGETPEAPEAPDDGGKK